MSKQRRVQTETVSRETPTAKILPFPPKKQASLPTVHVETARNPGGLVITVDLVIQEEPS